jgi:mannitol-specific phosphotransferase system IIBC component
MAILFGMDVISLVFPMIIGTMIQSYMGDSLIKEFDQLLL